MDWKAISMTNMESVVEAIDVKKSYGENEVLKGINLSVRKQEVMCLLGPSGSGKSTFLRCVNHLEKIDSGELKVEGVHIGYERDGNRLNEISKRKIAIQRSRIGMVFQTFNLFPHMTVLENIIEAPQRVRHISKAVAQEKAKALLAQVGLSEKIDAYPKQLSGGQQQRVAIARAMAMEPHLMLFDEPTSALDPELVGDVLEVIRGLATAGMTMIVVTHEIGFAREIADSVVFMDEGLVVESGNPGDVLDNPRNPRTQAFLSKVLR
jgi:polar amino acid transport system ATP-binding protein